MNYEVRPDEFGRIREMCRAMTLKHPATPDGRYFVVRGRLWRLANPSLPEELRSKLVSDLMKARRAVRSARLAGDEAAEDQAHREVDAAKHALGERGPVWWRDGAPDLNRRMAKNTLYAEWFASLPKPGGAAPGKS